MQEALLTAERTVLYSLRVCSKPINVRERGDCRMSTLIRKYKLASGLQQEERIDDPERIDRYFRLLDRETVKKLQAGQKVFVEKDEWQLLED